MYGSKPKAPPQSKEAARAEAERLVKEAIEKRKVSVTQGQTVRFVKCGKCGADNKVKADPGESRVTFKCKECAVSQVAL
jgi:hypothetical protein